MDYREEDKLIELEDIDYDIGELEDMYQLALKLKEKSEDENGKEKYDIDLDFADIVNTIDRKLEDYKEERDNIMNDLEDIRADSKGYQEWEYRRGRF